MSKQLDLEVEVLAEAMYRRHHANRPVNVPWQRRCSTVRDGYRAAARRELSRMRMMAEAIAVSMVEC